jgi:hypothetical protein
LTRSKNAKDKGTIRREGSEEIQKTLRDFTFRICLNLVMNLHPQWIAGFVDGEGCFHISINSHIEMTAGYQVLPEFTVVQHLRDIEILLGLKSYFNCGVVRVNHGDKMAFRVRSLIHLSNCIIPFFEEYPLRTKKRFEFEKFRSVIQMMKKGIVFKMLDLMKLD